MSHIVNPTDTEGEQQDIRVSDDNCQQLLLSILKELKKMNYHFALITDTYIESQDVES